MSARDHSWGVRYGVGSPVDDAVPEHDTSWCLVACHVVPRSCCETPDGERYAIHWYYQSHSVGTWSREDLQGGIELPDGSKKRFRSITHKLVFRPDNRRFVEGRSNSSWRTGPSGPFELRSVSDTGFHLGAGLYLGYERHGTANGGVRTSWRASITPTARESVPACGLHQLRDCVVEVRGSRRRRSRVGKPAEHRRRRAPGHGSSTRRARSSEVRSTRADVAAGVRQRSRARDVVEGGVRASQPRGIRRPLARAATPSLRGSRPCRRRRRSRTTRGPRSFARCAPRNASEPPRSANPGRSSPQLATVMSCRQKNHPRSSSAGPDCGELEVEHRRGGPVLGEDGVGELRVAPEQESRRLVVGLVFGAPPNASWSASGAAPPRLPIRGTWTIVRAHRRALRRAFAQLGRDGRFQVDTVDVCEDAEKARRRGASGSFSEPSWSHPVLR